MCTNNYTGKLCDKCTDKSCDECKMCSTINGLCENKSDNTLCISGKCTKSQKTLDNEAKALASRPKDGGWGAYGDWSLCQNACGSGPNVPGSTHYRYRECNNPAPANGGKLCSGKEMESKMCNTQPCAGGKVYGVPKNGAKSCPNVVGFRCHPDRGRKLCLMETLHGFQKVPVFITVKHKT